MIPMGQWLAGRQGAAVAAHGAMASDAACHGPPPADDAALRAAELAAAYARGRSDSDALTQQLLQGLVEQERAAHGEALAAARAAWAREEGEKFAAGLSGAMADLEARITRPLAAALLPFLEEQVWQKAIDEFMAAVKTLRGSGGALLRIEAPGDVLAEIRSHLGSRSQGIELVEGEGSEIRAVAEQSSIETCAESWLAALRGSVA